MIVRRERAHTGAQLTSTDHDGHRFPASYDHRPDIAGVPPARPHVEDHLRNDKRMGLANLPFRDLEHNRVRLALMMLVHDLINWTQRLVLTGELARCEPQRLRHRLLHTATRMREMSPAPSTVTSTVKRRRSRITFKVSLPRFLRPSTSRRIAAQADSSAARTIGAATGCCMIRVR